ncbi:Sulfofructose kinase [bacterium HR23]|nr:Sulfofructose kinase [bacterium HR23]
MPAPHFLAIGHTVRDRVPHGWRWGGSATYAVLTARRWGARARLLTAGDRLPSLKGVEVHWKPSPRGTAFENRYQQGCRWQRLLSRAFPLEPADLPPHWRETEVVLLAPVAQEVSPAFLECFPHALVGASAQGWLRRWTTKGYVFPAPLPADFPLARLHVLIASQEDVDDTSQFSLWAQQVPLVVMTRGREGAILWEKGKPYPIPAVPVAEVDPTGAGDVFSTVFLLRLWETGAPRESAWWASAAGALCVQRAGLAGVPSRRQVARLLSSPAWRQAREG